MKLTKTQAIKITKDHSLGKLISIGKFERGAVNFNTILETDKGKFIIRILGRKIDSKLTKRTKLEFEILDYLNKTKFPYNVPNPIKNKNGRILGKINGKPYWVYELIKGKDVDPIKGVTPKQNYEIGRALAHYHKAIRNLSPPRNKREINRLRGVANHYKQKRKIKPKNKLDKLMLDNLPMFEKILNKVNKINFETNMLYCHSDMHAANVLFNHGKIIGIIDFENIGYAPRIRDLSLSIKSGCDTDAKEKRFLKGYESVLKLTKKEKELIPLITLRDNCFFFDIFYGGKGNAKNETERIKRNMLGLNWIIESTKRMVERTSILEE